MGTRRTRVWGWVSALLGVGLVASGMGAPVAHAAPGDPFVNSIPPAIAGTAKVGEKLTAKPGSWQPVPAKVTYQWLRNGAPVAGSTATSYVLTAGDLGTSISLLETVSGGDLKETSASSTATAKVAAGTLKTSAPTISGSVVVGSTLTAVVSGWTAKVGLSYQWYASGKAISKATGAKLKLGNSHAGKRITVKVTGKLAGYAAASRVSAQTAKVLKALKSSSPKISGSAKVGSKLKAKTGSWTSKTKKSYQWLRDGAAIKKATKSSYTLTASDAGRKISVRVTGKRSGYATVTRTSKSVTVRGKTLKVGSPKVSGTAQVGATLTVNPGSWTKGTTLKYQWYADGAKVARGTGKSLRPGWLEAGRKLKVTVTGSKSGYQTTSKTVTLPKAISTDAVYQVGIDIPAGDLIGAGASYNECGWARVSDRVLEDGELREEDLLGFRSLMKGQALATVQLGDLFASDGCGRWAKLPTSGTPKTKIGNGDYAIGLHVQPGTWRTSGATDKCYIELATGFAGTDAEIYGEPYEATKVQEIELMFPGDLARISIEDCGTLTRVGDLPPDFGEMSRASRAKSVRVDGLVPTERRAARLDVPALVGR